MNRLDLSTSMFTNAAIDFLQESRTEEVQVTDPNCGCLILTVGGNWPDHPDESAAFPQIMPVDFLCMYQKVGP